MDGRCRHRLLQLPSEASDPGEYWWSIFEAARPLQAALREAGRDSIEDSIEFSVRIAADGHAVVTLSADSSSARIVRDAGVNTAEHVILVDGAVPEPVRRKPATYPGPRSAPSADPELLERVLRERMPDTVGATDAEIAAMLRVTRTCRDGRDINALGGIELFDLDSITRASEVDARKDLPFEALATVAVVTGPDSAVQGLVASPGWIVIGDHGGGTGDLVAVDLSPGPAGHVGQLVVLSHESYIGAWLLADSLTDLLLGRVAAPEEWSEPREEPPGKVADPLVISRLPGLEFLEIGLADWRALLDAGAVPRSLLAAGISGYNNDPAEVDEVYDALIRLWGGSGPQTVTIEGDLG